MSRVYPLRIAHGRRLTRLAARNCTAAGLRQHCFDFFPEPQGQGSLRPTLPEGRPVTRGGTCPMASDPLPGTHGHPHF